MKKILLILAVLLLSLSSFGAISGIAVSNSTQTTATVVWTTSTNESSQVIYGLNGLTNLSSPLDSSQVTSHSVIVTGLVAGQVYTYKVVSGGSTSAANTFSLCSAGTPNAGFSNVTGSVNVAYGQGLVSAVWTNDSGVSTSTPTVCGATFQTTQSGTLTPDGNLSLRLPDNNYIVPSPGRWSLTVTNATGAIGSFNVTTPIAGPNVGLTTQLQAAAAGKLQVVYYDAATTTFDPVISIPSGTGTVFNILSLAGVLCDGSHDDTAGIQAGYALLTGTFGGAIYWPPPGKQCVLSDTVTLANTQGTHIIGGSVVWKGVPANSTASTAAESGNVVTLTTSSGNWGAAFAANASIQVSGCSVTGYNGLSQIVSGGSGGTTMTFIAPLNVTGLGAATGCVAKSIPPMFSYDEDIASTTEGFRIAGSAVNPVGCAFCIKQDSTYGTQSQANIFRGNILEGSQNNGLNIGFEVAHGTQANPTNDEHKFEGNTIYNYATAGFVIDYFQSVDIHFEANACYAQAAGALACVIDTAGASFDWHGGFMHGNLLADFYGFGIGAHPITVESAGSEGSARFAWISQVNQNQTSAPCPVNLINDRFATNALNADGHMVFYECPGPLNVIGGSYGQFGTPGDFIWAPSATSPIIPYGSIKGVDSSGNNSVGKPLFNVFGTGPPIGNAVAQENNVYTDGSQKAVPPSTPDISYTINPTQVMDSHSGAAILNSFASCETGSAPTTLATGATITDTGLNCLPANSTIDGVVARVTTTITAACTGWELGDATTPARFSSNNGTLAAGTTTDAAHIGTFNNTGIASATTGTWQAAAAKVRITCAGGNPGAGAIRVIVQYHTSIPPTF